MPVWLSFNVVSHTNKVKVCRAGLVLTTEMGDRLRIYSVGI